MCRVSGSLKYRVKRVYIYTNETTTGLELKAKLAWIKKKKNFPLDTEFETENFG